MSTLFNYPKFKAFDTNGNFLIGGKLWTYQTGTQSLKATFHDKDLAQPHTNPIILDSNGEATIYFSSDGILYDLILTDANDVQLWTMDSIGGIGNVNTSGTVVANEVALFYDSSGSVIKGGLGDTGLIGILELENGVTLSDNAAGDRLYAKIGDAGAADLTVDDIDCNDIHATGTAIVDSTITFGAHDVILTTEDNETAAIKNAGNTDYAYLHCKNIIIDNIGTDDYSLLYNGRTETVIAESGYITAALTKQSEGTYRLTFTDFNPLTDGVVSIEAWGTEDLGDEVSLPDAAFGDPYVFNGTQVAEAANIRTYFSYIAVPTSKFSHQIVDITSTYIEFTTYFSVKVFSFLTADAGGTWDNVLPVDPWTDDPDPVDSIASVDWISIHVKKI